MAHENVRQPRKTIAMQLVEARLDRPVEDVIREVIDGGGDQGAVAERIGVDRSTVSRWMKDLGIDGRPRGRPAAEPAA